MKNVRGQVDGTTNGKHIIGYRVYRELTDNNGNTVHRTPVARTGIKRIACGHARAWSNGVMPNTVYELYSDGTEKLVYTC